MRESAGVCILALFVCACRPANHEPAEATPPTADTVVPALDQGPELEPGIHMREHVVLGVSGELRVWLYAPSRTAGTPRGCIVIAPAGSNLITGMKLGEGDRAEHLPWVRAGYVVSAFDIDGTFTDDSTETEVVASIKAFRDAEAGLANARAALDLALAVHPEIDPSDIYAVGHSSAGTLALLFAAREPRVRGVAAFAPIPDLVSWIPIEYRQALEEMMPGYGAFLEASSPATHAAALTKKPLFLFHAVDDDTVKPEELERFFESLPSRHAASTRVVVETGGHYDAMIDSGIPHAVAWLTELAEPPR
jgi:dienelactone hydrolase